MNESMIAIILYIGILVMAATVLVLTVIYFFRPGLTTSKHAEPPMNERSKTTVPLKTKPAQAPSSKAIISTGKDSVSGAETLTDKEHSGAIYPVMKEEVPRIELQAKPEQFINTNALSQSSGFINENSNQGPSKEISVAELQILQSLNNPASEIINPENDGSSRDMSKIEKNDTTEPERKEFESTMGSKQVKQPIKTVAEKTPATMEVVKPASTAAKAPAGKKAPEQKTTLDELSKMFTKEVVEDSEVDKLAKEMKDVEANNLVKDGLDLIYLLKRNRS